MHATLIAIRRLCATAALVLLAGCQTTQGQYNQTTQEQYKILVPQNDPAFKNETPARQQAILSAYDDAVSTCSDDGKKAVFLERAIIPSSGGEMLEAISRTKHLNPSRRLSGGGVLTLHICRSFETPGTPSPYFIAQHRAELTNPADQYVLGKDFFMGRGVSQNYANAVKWWRKAADQELAKAQNNLAVMYAVGRGVALDNAEAIKWWRKSASQGYAPARINLNRPEMLVWDADLSAPQTAVTPELNPDKIICEPAIQVGVPKWETMVHYRPDVEKAKGRGFTEEQCARLTGRFTEQQIVNKHGQPANSDKPMRNQKSPKTPDRK